MAIDLTTAITPSTPLQSPLLDSPFWFCRKLKRSQAETYPDSRENRLHYKTLRIKKKIRIKSSHIKFWIQNLRRHDQTGEFLFRICVIVCERQNQSDTKKFRIRHKSETVSSV